MPGRRVEVSHHDAKTTPHRHPGLAQGPRLVPGPIQKGRDLNTTPVGCFLDPEYRWGRFRDDGVRRRSFPFNRDLHKKAR